MDVKWVTDFKALRALFPVAAEAAAYDHDAVTELEIEELASNSALSDANDSRAQRLETRQDSQPVAVSGPEASASVRAEVQECPNPALTTDEMPAGKESSDPAGLPTEAALAGIDAFSSLTASEIPGTEFDVPEAAGSEFDVPDVAGGAELLDVEADYLPEVSEEGRARQLATEFLRQIGELKPRHVDWISEIILKRRWSSAKSKVIELYRARHGIQAIYRAFELSEAWRECECLDERFGDAANQSWYLQVTARITWLEAITLVSFFGDEASVEEILAFVERERYLWRQTPRFVQQFPRFKHYLINYRISAECRRPSLGWYRTLDPRDGRFFDGCANPEYTSDWWDEEVSAAQGPHYIGHRIFVGDQLSDLIPEQEDGIQWWED